MGIRLGFRTPSVPSSLDFMDIWVILAKVRIEKLRPPASLGMNGLEAGDSIYMS